MNKLLPALVLAVALAAPPLAAAQGARLKLPDFSGLAGRAKESVDISLDGAMLKNAGSFLGQGAQTTDPAARERMQAALDGIEGIYVRVFEFDEPDVYSQRDLDGVRRQLQAPGWQRLMSVRSGEEHVDMYLRGAGAKDGDAGMALVVSEPKSFVIVNIVGRIDLEKLRQLQGKFGVPGMPGMGSPAAPPPASGT